MEQNKQKALESAIAQIERQFGKGSIMKMDQNAIDSNIEVISTGSLAVDLALGVGGLPRGRIVEIFGQESSGKTTLALQVIAEAQKLGEKCVFIDAENAFDISYAEKLGINVQELLVTQPDSGEQALDIADMFVRSGSVGVIVVDSVAALVPKAELEGEMGASHVGLQARLMSQALRKLTTAASRSNILIIFINQIRMKIGVVYGNPETTTGGNALKFYSTIRLEVKRSTAIKNTDEVVGNVTNVKVVKNKVAPPFKVAETEIIYGEGFSKESEIIDLGVKYGIVGKSGAWFDYAGEKLGQGKEKVRQLLKENTALSAEIEEKVRAKILKKGKSTSEQQDEGN